MWVFVENAGGEIHGFSAFKYIFLKFLEGK